MRAASLLLVFAAAKTAALAGHHVPLSWWSPVAYLWQDALAALVFAALEFAVGARRRACWALYGLAALYVAINVPVVRALSTPLTWRMWRAAGGPLADSMRYYVTWSNALLFAFVLAVAALAPRALRRVPRRPLLAALALCAGLGPVAAARVDTLGLERNPWLALVPRPAESGATRSYSTSGFDRTPGEDLSRFRGAFAGRNIVMVSLESTAAQYVAPDVMPNLSRLAQNAIVFDNAYAAYPESVKGLFSVLCSAYPPFDSDAPSYAAAPCRSVAAMLSAAGYRTALFHSGRFIYLGMEAVVRHRGYDALADAGDIGGNHHSSFGVDEPATVARILAWIDALPDGRRFFVTYLPIAGHHPYDSPQPGPFPDREEFDRYRNALHYGDASLGTLIDGLRARGLERKTLWVVYGDHGEAFGQHEGDYGHTFFLYDENVRVPFLIAAPGAIGSEVHCSRVVSLIDSAPTLLDVVGLPAPGDYQGHSMLQPAPRMALFFADYSLRMLGLRDGRWKFIYEVDSGRSRLLDIEHDPRETTDLSPRHAAQARWYAENLRLFGLAAGRKTAGATSLHFE